MLDIISQQGALNKDIVRKREVFLNKVIKNARIEEARSISYIDQKRDRFQNQPGVLRENK